MTTETIPPAGGTTELEIPSDMYIGLNVVRRHIVEFFYRAGTQGLLSAGETPLAMFDCVLLEPNGRRLGGLTLHDYVVLTDQHLITWGRGLNRDIVDKFEWSSVGLDKFGRRTPIEGVIKIAYNLKASSGNKRRISIKSPQNGNGSDTTVNVGAAAPDMLGGVLLYLDLMPIGDVRICASMIHHLIKTLGEAGGVAGFKEQFRNDISHSQRRLASVNSLMRPFYMDLGNGMLVEADTVKDLRAVRTSPYRNPGSPYRNPAVRVNRGEASAAALNKGNRQTDTMRGGSRDMDTNAPGSGEISNLRETVRLNSGPIERASKLDDYEGRVSGRASRPTSGTVNPAATRAMADQAERSVRATPPSIRPPRMATPRPTPVSRTAGIRPARPERSERVGDVLDTPSAGVLPYGGNDRPVTMPIGVAIPRALLNPYSLSRLARGLWVDPRNLVRNAGDLSQTAEAAFEIAGVVNTDEDARAIAVSRVRSSAYSLFRDNLILHYTVWPFVKPLLDIVLLPVESEITTGRYSRLRVRTAGGEEIDVGDTDLAEMGAMTASDVVKDTSVVPPAASVPITNVSVTPIPPVTGTPIPPVTGTPIPPVTGTSIPPVTGTPIPPVKVTPESVSTVTEIKETVTKEDAPLNISGKGSSDPTAGLDKLPPTSAPPVPPSKLGGNSGDDGSNGKKIGFKK